MPSMFLRYRILSAISLLILAGAGLGALPLPDETAPSTPWAKMNHKQRKEYMKKTVLPKMKALFVEFDEDNYSTMRCETCHGAAGVKNGSYKMPNPRLPKLPSSAEEWEKLKAKMPSKFNFMQTKVRPTMAALLGEKEVDPKTGKGFKCFDCHTKR